MVDTVKQIAVLGSTGSIGRQTLDIVRAFPHRFNIIGLTAGQNLDLLSQQINEFKPEFVHYESKEKLHLQSGAGYKLLSPEKIACLPEVDIAVIATSGKAGLIPTLAAVKAGKTVALANKESLVMAGELVMTEAIEHSAAILPVDSEHSAIWQCLNGEFRPAFLILTASGGPFRAYSKEQLEKVTVEQALNHPSWKMGKKVTIDSATLMNKGLEIIEARWLFSIPFEKIRVLVHPQSIIHSMVEFDDGSIKAQLSHPDMRFPIQYALTYPERLANPQLRRLDWTGIKSLTFEQPDTEKFPCLRLAVEAGKRGGTCPAVLCGADEAAVGLFLSGSIRFTDISGLVQKTLDKHKPVTKPGLEEILEADRWAREKVLELAKKG